jgi:hypothetical protein
LADWNPFPPPSGNYIPDSYNNGGEAGHYQPVTATDLMLMNVLGWDLAPTPSASEGAIVVNEAPITAAAFSEDLTLNQIDPGSFNAPSGESYVIQDYALDIESLTAQEISAGRRHSTRCSSKALAPRWARATMTPSIRCSAMPVLPAPWWPAPAPIPCTSPAAPARF